MAYPNEICLLFILDPHEVFRSDFSDSKKINACEVAPQLCTAGLITREEKDEVDNDKVSSQESKSAKLLRAVERAIKLDDTKTKFDDFMGVLDKLSKYQELVKKVKGIHWLLMYPSHDVHTTMSVYSQDVI